MLTKGIPDIVRIEMNVNEELKTRVRFDVNVGCEEDLFSHFLLIIVVDVISELAKQVM